MLKKIATSSVLLALVHLLIVVAYANGVGGNAVSKTFDVIGQPGIYAARELGFGGFGVLDGLAGNSVGLWIVMALNSLLWGVVVSAVATKLFAFTKK